MTNHSAALRNVTPLRQRMIEDMAAGALPPSSSVRPRRRRPRTSGSSNCT